MSVQTEATETTELYPITPTKAMKQLLKYLDKDNLIKLGYELDGFNVADITQAAFIYNPLRHQTVKLQGKTYLRITSLNCLVRTKDGKVQKFGRPQLIYFNKNPKTVNEIFKHTQNELAVIIDNELKIFEHQGQTFKYYPYHIINADKLV